TRGSSAAMRKWQARISSVPPPRQVPLMAATTGNGSPSMASNSRCPLREAASASWIERSARISLTSAPAVNDPGLALTTTSARTFLSCAAWSTRISSTATSGADRRFTLSCGRSKIRKARPSRRVSSTTPGPSIDSVFSPVSTAPAGCLSIPDPSGRRLVPLEDERRPLAATDAQRGEAERQVATRHLLQQGQRQPRAGAPDRVPEGDGAAVDVGDRGVGLSQGGLQPQLGAGEIIRRERLAYRQHLRRERLVDLEEIGRAACR